MGGECATHNDGFFSSFTLMPTPQNKTPKAKTLGGTHFQAALCCNSIGSLKTVIPIVRGIVCISSRCRKGRGRCGGR